ncbi:prokineticin receptor 2-like [Branchiostoma lanceolatum]|uniref:prokineticin receptor 2-like n=1 Tax=Branchiostoma lanceolatum TaxID=7740 RepID=UPI003452733F
MNRSSSVYDYDFSAFDLEMIANLSAADGALFAEPRPLEPLEAVGEPLGVKIFLALVYILSICVCGVGNLLLLIVIAAYKKMRTITNALIANLAFSDFIVAVVCMPLIMDYYIVRPDRYWTYSDTTCTVINYLRMASLYVSTNSLLVIAIDRYVVLVCTSVTRMSPRAAFIVTVLVWVVSMLLAIPVAIYSQAVQYPTGGSAFCGQVWPVHAEEMYKAYYLTLFILQFALPVLIMGFCYIRISLRIWYRTVPGHQTDEQQMRIQQSKRRVVRLLMVIVVLFTLSWLPYYIYAIIRDFFPEILHDTHHNTTIYFIVEALGMSNNMSNTIVYIIMNKSARKHIKMLASDCRALRRNRQNRQVAAQPFVMVRAQTSSDTKSSSRQRREGGGNINPVVELRTARTSAVNKAEASSSGENGLMKLTPREFRQHLQHAYTLPGGIQSSGSTSQKNDDKITTIA